MASGPRVRKRVVTTHRVVPTWMLWGALIALLIAAGIVSGYTILDPKEVSGFQNKTIWAWLNLVGVSSAIIIVGWIVTRKQRERDEAIALEKAQDEALQAYLDQMSNLVVDHKLGHKLGNARSKDSNGEHKFKFEVWTKEAKLSWGLAEEESEDHIPEVAQARTTAVLLSLDARHKRRPLKLIHELGLIKTQDNVLDLKNAGLDHADLSELSLREAHLVGADLRVSDLSGADLSKSDLTEADLTEADLRGADLRRANLSNTILTRANLLPYDERDPERLSPHRLQRTDLRDETLSPRKLTMRDSRITIQKGREHWWPVVTELTVSNLRHAVLQNAQLDNACLGGADLSHADLREAILTKATFLRANLKEADLRAAKLSEADLRRANLYKANLYKANLRGAYLRGANLSEAAGITNGELEKVAASLEGATMPDGSKHP